MDFSSKPSSSDKKTYDLQQASPRPQSAQQKRHRLELDENHALSMTGVVDVPVFTDKNITVRLGGETLLVSGQGLAVKCLDVENGKLQVTGKVSALRYTMQSTPTSVVKKIFK